MNKFLASAALFLTFSQAEAHSHPGIDSLSHALEHLASNYSAGTPSLIGLGVVLVCLVWYSRRPQ
jgi:hypothetical protein